ncbi:MAG TPA: arylsulfatase, partial [Sinorhizobium sp.]|nr:arylsulfatase [Sinorhizobium sp.]
MTTHPRIALIHATPIAMDPIRIAFENAWPEAERVNILEDSLSPDRARHHDLTDDLTDRIVALAKYAQ